MTYAERLGATHLVDVATLTGAVARALGHLVTGAFGHAAGVLRRGHGGRGPRAGERYWQLPLIDDYVPEMDSWYGDLQNSGSAEGSLVKSGLFLREFVTKPWVHLDIAGTGYYRKATAVRAARRDRRRRTRRSSSWRSPGAAPAANGAVALDAWTRRSSRSSRRGPAASSGSPSGSPRTGSRRAGRSTTRSTRRAARSTGGPRSSARDRRAGASGCCRCGSRATRSRSPCSGPGS